jgi:hypothetical protein
MRARRRLLTLGLLASIAVAAVMAPTASAATSCGQLKGRVVVDKSPIKIVKKPMRRDGFRGYVFRGCARPSGRVRTLGYAGETLLDGFIVAQSRTSFTKARGTWLLRHQSGRAGEFVESSGDVLDVATGKRHVYWVSTRKPTPFCRGTEPVATKLDASGRFAAVYPAFGPTNEVVHTVEAWTTSAGHKGLDSALAADLPPASLRSEAGAVSWVNAGTPKSVPVTAETPTTAPEDC